MDQLDLWLSPHTWRRRVDTESGDPLLIFDEHYACECGDVGRLQMCPLALGEPRIGVNVVHYNGLAAFVRFQQPLSKGRHGAATDKRRDTVHMRQPHDVIRALDLGVVDAVHVQVLAQQPRSNFLYGQRIAEWLDRVRESKQECISL